MVDQITVQVGVNIIGQPNYITLHNVCTPISLNIPIVRATKKSNSKQHIVRTTNK